MLFILNFLYIFVLLFNDLKLNKMNKVTRAHTVADIMVENLDKNQLRKELYHLLIILPEKDLKRQLDLLTKK